MLSRRIMLSGASFAMVCAFSSNSIGFPTKNRAKPNNHVKPPADISPQYTAVSPIGPLSIAAKWAYILDYTTGTTLLEKGADEEMAPSSLTKIMTVYIVFALLKAGRIQMEQSFPVSEKAWRTQGSKMFVPLGQSVQVKELIQGVIVQSGNDACIVLAEGIASSEEQFVAMMNDVAQKMGLVHSHFMNSTGLPEDNHYMSARDIGVLAAHLIRDYPQYYQFFSEKEFRYNNILQGNRNTLIAKGLADGLKTGHTEAGGYGICVSSERDGNRIIMVLNGMSSMNVRAREGERLIGWAYANFENITFFKQGEIIDHVPVWLGEKDTVSLVTTRDVILTVPKAWRNRIEISLDYKAPLQAPLVKGQQVQAKITLQGVAQSSIIIPVVAGETVHEQGVWGRSIHALRYRFLGR